MALHSVADELLDEWIAWSSQWSEWKSDRDCRSQWRTFKARRGIGLGSLIKWAREDSPSWRPSSGESKARVRPRLPRPPRKEPPAKRPPLEEVETVWDAALPVSRHVPIRDWLESRGISRDLVERLDTARALCPARPCPEWAHVGRTSWAEGWPLIVPLYDHTGEIASLHARSIVPREPKSASPRGFEIRGLTMACPRSYVTLRGVTPHFRHAIVAEGVPDFLHIAARLPQDYRNHEWMALGTLSGLWGDELTDALRGLERVVIVTDADAGGDTMARSIQESLDRRRVPHRRQLPEELEEMMRGA